MYSKSKNSTVPDIYLNIGHLLDHFMMLIFAKAAYDSGRSFGLQYDEMILFGTLGMILFGATAPLAGLLSDKYGRIPLMIIYHFGIGFSAIIASMSSSPIQLAISLGLIGLFASIYHPVGIAMLLQRSGLVGLRLGINGVWGNMGIAIAPVVTGVTDGASVVYVHEEGVNNDTAALRAFIQSGDFDIQDGEEILSISRFIPDFKNQAGSADVLLSFKDYNSITNETTLNGTVVATGNITLTNSTQFPASGTVLIGTELITYSANNSTTGVLTVTTRGANGTTAAAHTDNTKVTNYSNVRINLSNVTPTTTKVDTRGRGRQGNIVISSNNVNDNWRFGTLRLDVKPDGGR